MTGFLSLQEDIIQRILQYALADLLTLLLIDETLPYYKKVLILITDHTELDELPESIVSKTARVILQTGDPLFYEKLDALTTSNIVYFHMCPWIDTQVQYCDFPFNVPLDSSIPRYYHMVEDKDPFYSLWVCSSLIHRLQRCTSVVIGGVDEIKAERCEIDGLFEFLIDDIKWVDCTSCELGIPRFTKQAVHRFKTIETIYMKNCEAPIIEFFVNGTPKLNFLELENDYGSVVLPKLNLPTTLDTLNIKGYFIIKDLTETGNPQTDIHVDMNTAFISSNSGSNELGNENFKLRFEDCDTDDVSAISVSTLASPLRTKASDLPRLNDIPLHASTNNQSSANLLDEGTTRSLSNVKYVGSRGEISLFQMISMSLPKNPMEIKTHIDDDEAEEQILNPLLLEDQINPLLFESYKPIAHPELFSHYIISNITNPQTADIEFPNLTFLTIELRSVTTKSKSIQLNETIGFNHNPLERIIPIPYQFASFFNANLTILKIENTSTSRLKTFLDSFAHLQDLFKYSSIVPHLETLMFSGLDFTYNDTNKNVLSKFPNVKTLSVTVHPHNQLAFNGSALSWLRGIETLEVSDCELNISRKILLRDMTRLKTLSLTTPNRVQILGFFPNLEEIYYDASGWEFDERILLLESLNQIPKLSTLKMNAKRVNASNILIPGFHGSIEVISDSTE